MENGKKIVLTPLEVSKELRCCRKTVYAMLKTNKLPHVKIGDMYMIPVSAFEKWLLECGRNQPVKYQQIE